MFNVKAMPVITTRKANYNVREKESLPSVFSGWGPSPPRTVGPH